MKISEMIKNLQEFMDEHGDLDCWYAEDDEGNGHHRVIYDPSVRYVNEYGEIRMLEDIVYDEENPDDYTKVCLVN